jgi:hypothetical protein
MNWTFVVIIQSEVAPRLLSVYLLLSPPPFRPAHYPLHNSLKKYWRKRLHAHVAQETSKAKAPLRPGGKTPQEYHSHIAVWQHGMYGM